MVYRSLLLCLQVLEELEKVKGHCKDYEMKNTTLHTEIEALQQQLKVNVLFAVVNDEHLNGIS